MPENIAHFPSSKNNRVGGFLAEKARKDVSLFSSSSASPLLIFACSPLQRLKSGDHSRLPDQLYSQSHGSFFNRSQSLKLHLLFLISLCLCKRNCKRPQVKSPHLAEVTDVQIKFLLWDFSVISQTCRQLQCSPVSGLQTHTPSSSSVVCALLFIKWLVNTFRNRGFLSECREGRCKYPEEPNFWKDLI